MNELKIHVERAVRPVQAALRTKLRMRNELYAHLLEIHEEESAKTSDEQAAIAATINRFGDPESLTAELQQTVSRIEVYEGRLDGWIWRRESESYLQHAFRLAVSYSALIPICLFAILLLWLLQESLGLRPNKSPSEFVYSVTRFGLSMLVYFVIQVFAVTLIGSHFYQQFNDSWLPRSLPTAIALSLGAGIFVLATGWLLLLVMVGSIDESIALLFPYWTILATLVSIGLACFNLVVRYETEQAAPWTSLQIDN